MSELHLIIQPDAEEPEAAEVYVDGVISDKAYRFLLDTGAARTSIKSDELITRFERVGEHHSSGVFAKITDDLITIPRLEVGPIIRENFTITRIADGNPHIRNVIGMDLLKDYCCHFQFDQRRVLLVEDEVISADNTFHTLHLDSKFHPYVEVQYLDAERRIATANAVWDTGASMTIADINFIAKYPAAFQEVGRSTGTDATGSQVETPMYIISETIISSTAFPAHKVAAVDLSQVNSTLEVPMDLILGYNTLSKAHWLFDFPRRRWCVSKSLVV